MTEFIGAIVGLVILYAVMKWVFLALATICAAVLAIVVVRILF